MANLSLYHANVLADSALSASNVATGSSVDYAADNRLSYKLASTTSGTTIQIDQPGSAINPFQFLVLVDHNLGLGTAVVRTFPTANRLTETVLFSGSLTTADPNVIDLGSQTDKQYIDVELSTSGTTTVSVGEVMLATKFDSPQRPQLGINTAHVPRSTAIDFPNGERASIKHAETARRKEYVIPGLSLTEAALWVDLFRDNEGVELVVLSDDEGDVYPAYMSRDLATNTTARKVSLSLTFTEVKL